MSGPQAQSLSVGHTSVKESPMPLLARAYVLLLNWNGWEHTLECIESVLRLTCTNAQVIVCDNDSSDGSVERIVGWAAGTVTAPQSTMPGAEALPPIPKPVLCVVHDRAAAEAGGAAGDKHARVVVLRTGSNGGFAFGNNVGLRYVLARGDAEYVWLLNNDTVVDPGSLSALVDAAEADPGLGMVGAKLLFYDEPDCMQAAGGGTLAHWNGSTRLVGEGARDTDRCDGSVEPEYVHGASLLVRTSLLREVGLMDETYFMYSEEVDWCLRARRAGWKLGYAPAARVWHKDGRASAASPSYVRDFHSLRSRLILVRKFYPGFLPLALVHSVYQCVLPKVVRRQPNRLRAVLRAYADFFGFSS